MAPLRLAHRRRPGPRAGHSVRRPHRLPRCPRAALGLPVPTPQAAGRAGCPFTPFHRERGVGVFSPVLTLTA